MSSRLIRLILVNGVISGTHSSQRICEMRLPGGTAITGENGSGKTTTMSALGLFFGASPGSIVPRVSKGSKDPMLDFMLPLPTSALVFEYQRGDRPEDLRLVTIRRRPDGAPEYRIFKTPFVKELFVQEFSDGLQFLTDEQTKEVARKLGIERTQKLTTAQYRGIIQKLKSFSKDTKEVRDYQRLTSDYSFASKPLLHLDRVMTSIIKEKVEFKDLIDVCTALVVERNGGDASKKIELKNMRSQCGNWIDTRKACADAVAQKNKIAELRDQVRSLKTNFSLICSLHNDVIKLRELREKQATVTTDKLNALNADRQEQESQEAEITQQLEAHYEQIIHLQGECQASLSRLNSQKSHLIDNNAQHWAQQLPRLDSLQSQLQQTQGTLRLAQSKAADITTQIDEALQKLALEIQFQSAKFEEKKEMPRNQLHDGVNHSFTSEAEVGRQLEAEHREAMDGLSATIHDLCVTQASKTAHLNSGAVNPELVAQLDEAREILERLGTDLDQVAEQERKSSDALMQSRQERDQSMAATASAQKMVKSAQQELEEAQLAMSPPEGSLLQALRKSGNREWERNLARIIDPKLIESTSLSPQFLEASMDGTAFGWSLNTEVLETPDWANLTQMELTVSQKSEALSGAEFNLKRIQDAESSAHKKLKSLEDKDQKVKGLLSIAKGKREEQKLVVESIARAIQQSKADRARLIQAELQALSAQIAEQKGKETQAKELHSRKIKAHRGNYESHRADLKIQCEKDIASIDAQKREYLQSQDRARSDLEIQRNRLLTEAGVDKEHVLSLERQIGELSASVDAILKNTGLAREWNDWIKDSGEQLLIEAQAVNSQHSMKKQEAEAQRSAHKTAMAQSHDAYKKLSKTLGDELDRCTKEVEHLKDSSDSLQEFSPMLDEQSLVKSEINAMATLKGQVKAAQEQRLQLTTSITQDTGKVERKLTSGSNSVTALISGFMAENPTDAPDERALFLCEAYDKIDGQIISTLYTELSTILETCNSFFTTASRFKAGVAGFNTEFQRGIANVARNFARLQDFEIEITCDLGEKGVFSCIEDLQPLMNEYRGKFMQRETAVPDASITEKLNVLMAKLGDGQFEMDMSRTINVKGSCKDNGKEKSFANERDLVGLSSTGISALAMVIMLSGLLNVQRGENTDVYLPWASDEIGKFDQGNLFALINMLGENKIDVMTASPQLSASSYALFQQRYLVKPKSIWAIYSGSVNDLARMNKSLIKEAEPIEAPQTDMATATASEDNQG